MIVVKRRRSKSIKRRKSKSIKRRRSKSIKRRRSKSIKRRRSKSIKRKSIRRKKSNDGGIIDIKNDEVRNEMMFLIRNERNLVNQIETINSKENPIKEIFNWLNHETDISNFFNLCYYGCYTIIETLLEKTEDVLKKQIVALQSVKLMNCYFYIIDGFDRYCFNDEEVKKRYYNLLDYLLNINDEKLTSCNNISDKETPINICFLNCLKYRKFINPNHDNNRFDLNLNELKINSTVSVNRDLICVLFIKIQEKTINDMIQFVNDQYEIIDKDRYLKILTLKTVYENLLENKAEINFDSFLTKRKTYYDDDSQFCEFIVAKLNNMIKIKKNEAEKKAEKKALENMNKLLKEEESPKIRTKEESPKIRTPNTTKFITTVVDHETIYHEKIDSLSKYEEAFNSEEMTNNIKFQTKTFDSLSGILAITCFLKYNGNSEKEISLHGLWPDIGKTDIDKKYKDNCEHNEKINLDLNLLKPVIFEENNTSCFSNFSLFFLRHEWNKHGIYANKYESAQEYLNEACELAKPVLFFLFYMDQIKFRDGEEYDFSKISNDIEGSLFSQYVVNVIDNDKYQELHFRVCANYDETKKKYDWGFCDE